MGDLFVPLRKGGCYENGDCFRGDVRGLDYLLSGHGLVVHENSGAGLLLFVSLRPGKLAVVFLLDKAMIGC